MDIIYIIAHIIFFDKILFLVTGKLFKYSIVLSLSSFNKIFEPIIEAYTPVNNNINKLLIEEVPIEELFIEYYK